MAAPAIQHLRPLTAETCKTAFHFSFYNFKLNIHEQSSLLGTVSTQRTKKAGATVSGCACSTLTMPRANEACCIGALMPQRFSPSYIRIGLSDGRGFSGGSSTGTGSSSGNSGGGRCGSCAGGVSWGVCRAIFNGPPWTMSMARCSAQRVLLAKSALCGGILVRNRILRRRRVQWRDFHRRGVLGLVHVILLGKNGGWVDTERRLFG